MGILMAKKAKKRYPVQRHIGAISQLNAANVQVNCDKLLSEANHRLYRQGRFYNVKIDIDMTQVPTNPIRIYALRDTWFIQKAYQMAYDMFREATQEERDRVSSTNLARWNDFRVKSGSGYDSVDSRIKTATGSLVRSSGGSRPLSEVEDSNGNTKTFAWANIGGSFDILGEYGRKASPQTSPVFPVSDIPYSDLQEDISNVEVSHITGDGANPPYPFTSFEDEYTLVATLWGANPESQRLSTGFFTAPCGIVLIEGLPAAQQTGIHVTFKQGDYKGVDAPSMLEA